jgi:hypothetical protein
MRFVRSRAAEFNIAPRTHWSLGIFRRRAPCFDPRNPLRQRQSTPGRP